MEISRDGEPLTNLYESVSVSLIENKIFASIILSKDMSHEYLDALSEALANGPFDIILMDEQPLVVHELRECKVIFSNVHSNTILVEVPGTINKTKETVDKIMETINVITSDYKSSNEVKITDPVIAAQEERVYLKDFYNNIISVGDYITYPVRTGSWMRLHTAKVKEIKEDQLKIAVVNEHGDIVNTIISVPSRTVIIPKAYIQYHPYYKSLLEV
jgi:hypothetical protein